MVEPIQFPDIELYRGWGEPMRANIEMQGLELISGAVPDDIAFYRPWLACWRSGGVLPSKAGAVV